MSCLFSVGGRRTVSEPVIQLTDGASCATVAGNATVFGPPYLEAREQEPPFAPRTCSPSFFGHLAQIKWPFFPFLFFVRGSPNYPRGGGGTTKSFPPLFIFLPFGSLSRDVQ